MRPATRLRQRGTNVNRFQPSALGLLLLMRHRVRDHDPTQATPVQGFQRIAAENTVRDDGDDLVRAVLHDGVGGLDERAAGVGHVVNEDGGFATDVADEDHAGDFVGARPLFVDEGETEVEPVGDGGSSVLGMSVCARWPP